MSTFDAARKEYVAARRVLLEHEARIASLLKELQRIKLEHSDAQTRTYDLEDRVLAARAKLEDAAMEDEDEPR